MNNMKNIGWVGLGNMGTPMATNLIKAGYNLFAYYRNNNVEKEINTEQKATPIFDWQDLVSKTEVIFLTLPDDAAVTEVSKNLLETTIEGKIIVNSSTISPELALKLFEEFSSKQAFYVDAPVSGSVKPAEDGTLLFLLGGEESLCNQLNPILEKMSKQTFYLGEAGKGSKAKLAINYYMSVIIQGLAETVQFAEQNGIEKSMMTAIVNESACGSGMSKIKTPNIIAENYPAAFPLKFMLKDIRLTKSEGWNTPMLKAVEQAYTEATANGLAEQDLMAVIEMVQNKN